MRTIGYIRVSTEQQNLDQQKHLLFTYAQQHKFLIDEFIEVEVSSQKSQKDRKIDLLLEKLQAGDRLLVAELSRLGRNMLETLNMIDLLIQNQIAIIFVRQPELSTIGGHGKLLSAVYSYFAEAEQKYISMRTKQGLAALKAAVKELGRPKGSQNKKARVLDPYKDQIIKYLNIGISMSSIVMIINNQLQKPITYCAYIYYIKNDSQLNLIYEDRKIKKRTLDKAG